MRYKSIYDSRLRDIIWFVIKYRDMYCIFIITVPMWSFHDILLLTVTPSSLAVETDLGSLAFLSQVHGVQQTQHFHHLKVGSYKCYTDQTAWRYLLVYPFFSFLFFPNWIKSFNWNSTIFYIFDIFQVRVYTKKDKCKRRTVQLIPSDSPWLINMHIDFNTCWICLLILWGLKHNN